MDFQQTQWLESPRIVFTSGTRLGEGPVREDHKYRLSTERMALIASDCGYMRLYLGEEPVGENGREVEARAARGTRVSTCQGGSLEGALKTPR